MNAETPVLQVRSLNCSHAARGPLPWRRDRRRVVRDVSFELRAGETLGVVGESGCGKTTLARALLRLICPESGEILLHGRRINGDAPGHWRRELQIVFQDPDRSLSPRRTVAQTLDEALALAEPTQRAPRSKLLEAVQLDVSLLDRYPAELSGGQRQRVAIARALAPNPSVLVADEPVSALDVSVQAQILNLLMRLQERFGLAMLFIGHDLAVVRRVSHRVAVMYLGEFVETGPADAVLASPAHPYTRALLASVPDPDPAQARDFEPLQGDVPPAGAVPGGCPFHPRCPRVMDVCRTMAPREIDLGSGETPHLARCHLHEAKE